MSEGKARGNGEVLPDLDNLLEVEGIQFYFIYF